jgi:PAS domain S-box-containing protein
LVERKQAEVALYESQAMLRLIFENAFDGISVYEEYPEQNTRRLIDCNTRYAEIAGRSREELLSMGNTLPIQKNVDSSLTHHHFLDRLSSGMYMGRFSWLRPDGRDNVVEYASVPLEMDGRLLVVGVDRDITAQMQAAREREALIEKLEMQNAELERFNYTVSHDLKTPLVTIKGFLGYILEDAAAGNVERLKQDAQRIARAVDRMNNLLKDLLEFSRIGRLINPAEEIPFELLVREAVEQVEERLKAGGIRLIIHDGLPTVHGDAHRLLEVLQNLIDNAAKFMGDQPEPRIEIGCKEQDGKHVFFVQDNGIGIDPRFHTQVFGLFNKLDPHAEGTGVGLALVKRIVEFHGGRIWVESESGRGSTFFFTLPDEFKFETGQ